MAKVAEKVAKALSVADEPATGFTGTGFALGLKAEDAAEWQRRDAFAAKVTRLHEQYVAEHPPLYAYEAQVMQFAPGGQRLEVSMRYAQELLQQGKLWQLQATTYHEACQRYFAWLVAQTLAV